MFVARVRRTHAAQALEDGDLDELEELEHTYDRLLFSGFVAGRGFYPLDHDHTVPVRGHEQLAQHEALVNGEDKDAVSACPQPKPAGLRELARRRAFDIRAHMLRPL